MSEGAAEVEKKQDGKSLEAKQEAPQQAKEKPAAAEAPSHEGPSEEPTPSRRSLREALPPQAFARVMPSARRVLRQRASNRTMCPPRGPVVAC